MKYSHQAYVYLNMLAGLELGHPIPSGCWIHPKGSIESYTNGAYYYYIIRPSNNMYLTLKEAEHVLNNKNTSRGDNHD